MGVIIETSEDMSSFDTVLEIYTGAPGSLATVTCNDVLLAFIHKLF